MLNSMVISILPETVKNDEFLMIFIFDVFLIFLHFFIFSMFTTVRVLCWGNLDPLRLLHPALCHLRWFGGIDRAGFRCPILAICTLPSCTE